jgi:hypothetical protein
MLKPVKIQKFINTKVIKVNVQRGYCVFFPVLKEIIWVWELGMVAGSNASFGSKIIKRTSRGY